MGQSSSIPLLDSILWNVNGTSGDSICDQAYLRIASKAKTVEQHPPKMSPTMLNGPIAPIIIPGVVSSNYLNSSKNELIDLRSRRGNVFNIGLLIWLVHVRDIADATLVKVTRSSLHRSTDHLFKVSVIWQQSFAFH
jgi:hypothetical protein